MNTQQNYALHSTDHLIEFGHAGGIIAESYSFVCRDNIFIHATGRATRNGPPDASASASGSQFSAMCESPDSATRGCYGKGRHYLHSCFVAR